MEADLMKEFSQNNFTIEDSETAQQCLSLCASYTMTASDLVASWEVFYLNMQLDNGLVQRSQLEKFRQYLQHEQREAFRRKHSDLHFYTRDDVDMLLNDENDPDEIAYGTTQAVPKAKRVSTTGQSRDVPMDVENSYVAPKTPASHGKTTTGHRPEGSPLTPFSQRNNKYMVQFVFNKDVSEDAGSNAIFTEASEDDFMRRLKPIQRLPVKILNPGPYSGCRYMYDRLESKFNELDKRIRRFGLAIAEHEQKNITHHVALASQEQVTVVGRVCCDGEGHLNNKSILLEGSVEDSGGQRVRLDLHKTSQYSLFPGQVLAVEGHNPSGHCLVASRVIDSFPLPLYLASHNSESGPRKRQASNQTVDLVANGTSTCLSLLAVAGPYTTTDNLSFEPLGELLSYCRKRRPNILLLLGPFVDSEHPQIKQGLVDKIFKHVFQEEIRTRIEEYCEEMGEGARVMLVPSSRDAHHDCVFPQPPFENNLFEDSGKQITLLTNPGSFQIDKVTVGCCSTDVLRHLSSEELAHVPLGAPSDRMARLAGHIVGQRSFYPLFPAAPGVPLDFSVSPEAISLVCTPDVLILPSDLAPFVKVLPSSAANSAKISGIKSEEKSESDQFNSDTNHAGTICVNPGRLAKGIFGGTFAEILIPAASEELSEALGNKNLLTRTKVVVTRI